MHTHLIITKGDFHLFLICRRMILIKILKARILFKTHLEGKYHSSKGRANMKLYGQSYRSVQYSIMFVVMCNNTHTHTSYSRNSKFKNCRPFRESIDPTLNKVRHVAKINSNRLGNCWKDFAFKKVGGTKVENVCQNFGLCFSALKGDEPHT